MENDVSLKSRTLTGIFWSFIDLVARQGVQFVIQIILARLLLPEHFGIIGMTVLFIALANVFIDSGFSQALIRDQQTTDTDYSTVFYFNLAAAIVIYIILFTTAPSIGRFYGEPQLVPIIRVLAVVVLLCASSIIQRVILTKAVDFKTQSKISMIAVLISGTVTIILALSGFGVWSLVFNVVSMQLIQSILLWVFNRWMPSLTFSVQSFKKYYHFGYKILLSNLLETFYENVYFLLIGRFYSSKQLGLYTNAVKVRDLASMSIAATVQRVTYPVLSMMEEEEQLKAGFRKIIKMSAFINFPLMIGLAAVAEPLFMLLLGEKWLASVIYFQLLCVAGMLYPLHAINLNILQVKGRSDLFLFIEILKKVLLTVLIGVSLFFKWGIIGLICVAVVHSYLSLFINTYFSTREIAYSLKEQLIDIAPVYVLSFVMGISVYLFEMLLPNYILIKFFVSIVFGVIFYIAGCKILNIEEFTTTYAMLKAIIGKVKKWNRLIYGTH